jgi:hypothetical protein
MEACMPVVRYLEWYDQHNEAFAGRVDLDLTLAEIQKLFDIPRGDPMYDCREVKREHVESLQTATGLILDLDRYAYFVSAESV